MPQQTPKTEFPPPLPPAKAEVPKAGPGALKEFEAEIKSGVGIDAIFRKIDEDKNLNPVERVAKMVSAVAILFQCTVDDLGDKVDEFCEKIGFKEPEEAEAYLPGALEPPEEYFADGDEGNVPVEKITPSEEKDILAFLQEKVHVDEKGKKKTWLDCAKQACSKFGVPIFVLLAIMRRESGFKPDARTYIDPKTGQYASSALGLGQFLNRDWGLRKLKSGELVLREQGGFLNAPHDENPWGKNADRTNPEHAIWATARHIRNKMRQVNADIEHGKFPPHFRINLEMAGPVDVKWIYMAYMNGATGYCLLRQYLENQTAENFAKLDYRFQKRPALYKNTKTGETHEIAHGGKPPEGPEWKRLRLSHVDAAQKCSNSGVKTALAFYNQLMKNNPALTKVHLQPFEATV